MDNPGFSDDAYPITVVFSLSNGKLKLVCTGSGPLAGKILDKGALM
jgi:hypothetical protein